MIDEPEPDPEYFCHRHEIGTEGENCPMCEAEADEFFGEDREKDRMFDDIRAAFLPNRTGKR